MNAGDMQKDTLKRLDLETMFEGDRMLTGQKSRNQHNTYILQIEKRLAAIGATWMDLIALQNHRR